MSISSIREIEARFSRVGVNKIYIKLLAAKQDNDKNQIYLGNSGKGTLNLFKGTLTFDGLALSESQAKRHSSPNSYKACLNLDFYWLDPHLDKSYRAPNAKIIDYLQYPEARFSGFLSGCENGPDELRRVSLEKFGRRALLMGSGPDGRTYGLTATSDRDPVYEDLARLPQSTICPLFRELVVGGSGKSDREMLIGSLSDIVGRPYPGMILKSLSNGPKPYAAKNAAGYTLEALLGVEANAKKEPDIFGYELKTFSSGGKISLMTPTADLGVEGEKSFKEFMKLFGRPGKKDPERIVFNGLHKYGSICKATMLTLRMAGYDHVAKEFSENLSEVYPYLRSPSGELVSGWSFEKLMDAWSNKHAKACYVEYEKRDGVGGQYLYPGTVYICEGTNIFKYLRAIINTTVNYDPAYDLFPVGHSRHPKGKPSVRPQWRMASTKSKFKERLSDLYEEVDLLHL